MFFSAVSASGLAYLSELQRVYTPSRTLRSSSDGCQKKSVVYETECRHACWKSNNTNARLMVFAPSLALDPTSGIHSHKTLDTAQPCRLLKPN